MKYLLRTTLGVETGPSEPPPSPKVQPNDPAPTPSTKRFTIGIPYLYAVVFEYHTRDSHPWLEPFADGEPEVSEGELERRRYNDVAPGVKAVTRE